MARNVLLTVVHPTETEDTPPKVTNLASWRLESKNAAATEWTQLGGDIAIAQTTRLVEGIPDGDWNFRAFWKDDLGKESDPAQVDVSVVTPPVENARPKPGTITAQVV